MLAMLKVVELIVECSVATLTSPLLLLLTGSVLGETKSAELLSRESCKFIANCCESGLARQSVNSSPILARKW